MHSRCASCVSPERITAISDFYENKLELTGLELWSELNGRTYDKLPGKIKAGIDRRSISSIVLITESTSDSKEALFLKQLAFERLNTGGVALNPQEIRNCLYSGKFNQLLLDLARHPIFTDAWKIPIENHKQLKQNNLYKKMEDAELVLRFFALRHIDHFRGGMEQFLNVYMMKTLKFDDRDIKSLKELFMDTIELAREIYGDNLFKPFDPKSQIWKDKAYKVYYDAVMVGFSNHISSADTLVNRKSRVLEATKQLFEDDKSRLFSGGRTSKAEIQERIQRFDDMLARVIAE